MSADALAAWTALLDQFEMNIDAWRRGDEVTDWATPDGFPPLPGELTDRARDIARRQKESLANAVSNRGELSKHLAAVESIPGQRNAAGGPAIYLDVTG